MYMYMQILSTRKIVNFITVDVYRSAQHITHTFSSGTAVADVTVTGSATCLQLAHVLQKQLLLLVLQVAEYLRHWHALYRAKL